MAFALIKNIVSFFKSGVPTDVSDTDPLPVDTGLTLQTDALTNVELRASPVGVSGTVELGSTSLSALENITVTVSNEVEIKNDVNSPVPVSGTVSTGLSQPLTDTQLRANAVAISNTNLDVALSTRLKPADTLAAVTTLGTITNVVHVDDNAGSLTVDGTVTANAGTGNFAVVQTTGTNLHTVVDSGTISAITNVVHVDDNSGSLTVDGTVAVSSVGGTVAVSGPLTDTQLRASPIDVDTGLVVQTDALTDSELRASPVSVTARDSVFVVDVGNGKLYLPADGTTLFTGTAFDCRNPRIPLQSIIAGQQVVIASNVRAGVGGTFTFEFSNDLSIWYVSEIRTIRSFSSVRDFPLQNVGLYFRVKFVPSRALIDSEFIAIEVRQWFITPPHFVRLANQQIEEANAAMSQTFAYVKAFDAITGESVNIRPTEDESLKVADQTTKVTSSGSNFVESIRDDISHRFTSTYGTAEITKLIALGTTSIQPTLDSVNGQAVFTTSTTVSEISAWRSQKIAVYETGHGIRGEQTIEIELAPLNDEKYEWGFVSDDLQNGSGWGWDGVGKYTWRRKNGVYAQKTYQTDWNRDRCDGIYPSLFKKDGVATELTFQKDNLFVTEFEWLGADGHTYGIKAPTTKIISVNIEEYPNSNNGSSLPTPELGLHIAIYNSSTAPRALALRTGSWRGGIYTSKAILTGRNPNGDFVDIQVQGNDPGNLTNTPLIAGGVFRGIWFNWQKNYVKMVLDMISDVSGTIYIDFSEEENPVDGDDSSVDDSAILSYDPSNLLYKRSIPVQSKWVRIRYINGIAAQSMFNLDVAYLTSDSGLVVAELSQLPRKKTLAGYTRSVPAIPTGDGTAYQEIPVDTSGIPKSHITSVDGDVMLRSLQTAQTKQKIIGITADQIDIGPLANRKSFAVANDEASNKAYIGFNSGLTQNNGFPLPAGRVVIVDLQPGVELWAVAKDTGSGVQVTQTLVGTSNSGTATNTVNSKVADSTYSNITAVAQTVDIGGFSITPTASASIQNVLIGVIAKKQANQLQTVTFQEVQRGNTTNNVGGVTTNASLTGGANMAYVAIIGRNNAATVTGVSGLGLTWTQTATVSSGTSVSCDIWTAYGTGVTGTVTATLSATGHNTIQVLRFTGADPTVVQDNKTNSGSSSTASVTGFTATNKGYAVLGLVENNKTSTPPSGYTEQDEVVTGTFQAADTKAITFTGTETPGNITLSGSTSWAMVGISILPATAIDPVAILSYTLSASPGVTSEAVTVVSSADSTTEVDITSDRAWAYADIPNIHVIATGSTIGSASFDSDQLYVKVVESTGPTCDIRLMEVGGE